MKTGNTDPARPGAAHVTVPQWSPVMKTGNTAFIPSDSDRRS